MDPEMDPARLIFGDPYPKKVLQGPYKVHIDIFLDRSVDNRKLKFTELNNCGNACKTMRKLLQHPEIILSCTDDF